jgi:hypothetical protein
MIYDMREKYGTNRIEKIIPILPDDQKARLSGCVCWEKRGCETGLGNINH